LSLANKVGLLQPIWISWQWPKSDLLLKQAP